MTTERLRQPVFGKHGRKVVAGLCAMELAGLLPNSPVPTITEVVRKYKFVGGILLGLLVHHFFLELERELGIDVGDLGVELGVVEEIGLGVVDTG